MSLHKDYSCASITMGSSIMTAPKYFEHEDKCISFIEWKALEKFTGQPSHKQYPDHNQRYGFWADHFTEKKKQWHLKLYQDFMNGTIPSLVEFYKVLEARVNGRKPRALGANERKQQTQREYQKERLGDAFVENDALISAIKLKAKELANTRTPDDDFLNEVSELASELSETPLSEDQIKAMSGLISNEISRRQALDRAEATLIDMDNKDAWFLWGKIKRNHTKESKFTLSVREVAAYTGASKDKGTELKKALVDAGVIEELSKGKSSKTERIAGLYKRLL